MSLLSFVLPRRYEDAVLGTLTRGWGCWRGRIALGADPPLPLVLAGWSSPPAPARLQLARELVGRYEALQPAIAQALFEHYAPYAEAIASGDEPPDPRLPRIERPVDVWPHVRPIRVRIETIVPILTVEIAYRVTWDDEHTLGARFQDWTLVELNGSVRA